MRSPSEIKRVIEGRLRSYLSRDRTGIRREVLMLFVKTGSITIAEIVAELQKRFTVTFHAIASMVGIIASRIGILRATRNTDWSEQLRTQGKVCRHCDQDRRGCITSPLPDP